MGYRLEISEVKHVACGGKLYGYTKDLEKLESYQWLKSMGYISEDGNDYWDYGYDPQIVLTPSRFKEFIELYIEDKRKYYDIPTLYTYDGLEDGLLALAETNTYKLLQWY